MVGAAVLILDDQNHLLLMKRSDSDCRGLPGGATEPGELIEDAALPEALFNLKSDPTPAAQIYAAVTYNMIVEGVLAETGYHAFFTMLERNGLMPGLRKGISLLKQDKSRHLAYGVYLLSRLMAEHPDLWATLETQMNSLLPFAIGVISDAFAAYDVVPFGLVEDDFIAYAMAQFSKRFERLEKAKGQSLDEINRVTKQVIEVEDA